MHQAKGRAFFAGHLASLQANCRQDAAKVADGDVDARMGTGIYCDDFCASHDMFRGAVNSKTPFQHWISHLVTY